MSDMQAWNNQYKLEQQNAKQKLADKFDDWLYQNYSIGNGHRLVQLMEDTTVVARFLKDAGLPADTEF